MTSLRMLATTAAGVWLGGMILMAIVAMTTFSEMRKTGISQPNSIAGQVMAVNFRRFDKVQIICVCVLVIWQVVSLIGCERTFVGWLRLAAILLAGGLLIYSVNALTPKILDLQTVVGEPNPEAAVKAIFDDFHRSAVRISKINLVLVTIIVFSLAWRRSSGEQAMEKVNRAPTLTESNIN